MREFDQENTRVLEEKLNQTNAKCTESKQIEWLLNGDTGLSSKTIFCVMTGHDYPDASIPHDASDFGRCYELLRLFPEWLERLPEIYAKYPEWEPFIVNWDILSEMYDRVLGGNMTIEEPLRGLIRGLLAFSAHIKKDGGKVEVEK